MTATFSLWVRHRGSPAAVELCQGVTRGAAIQMGQQMASVQASLGLDATWSDVEPLDDSCQHSVYYVARAVAAN